jgi:phosphopantothenoylcysteine synthetase/decarboxylase
MNTLMYEHPLTSEHLRVVREIVRYEIVGPVGKALACGDVGASFFLSPREPSTRPTLLRLYL